MRMLSRVEAFSAFCSRAHTAAARHDRCSQLTDSWCASGCRYLVSLKQATDNYSEADAQQKFNQVRSTPCGK